MNISLIYYPITTLGPGKRMGIWTSGCHKNCLNCMSPQAKEFDEKLDRSIASIVEEIKKAKEEDQIDGITISGGEPFDQKELLDLLSEINKLGIEDILVYSGYLIEDLKDYQECLKKIAVLIDGPYIDRLNDDMPLRGSSNQNIYILKNEFQDRYVEYLKIPRSFNLYVDKGGITIIGLLPHNGKENIDEIIQNIKKKAL